MKHSLLVLALGLAILVGAFSGCTEKPQPSVFDPNWQSAPAPTITSLTSDNPLLPPSTGFAGVTVVTIKGTNFSPTIANDLVYFGTAPGTVLTASSTTLTVRTPQVVKDSLQVTVAVQGSQYFSNYVMYSLKSAVSGFSVQKNGEDPNGIACDTAGNVYVSLVSTASGSALGVWKIAPDGTRQAAAYSVTSGVTKWTGLKMGPGGVLYAARNLQALYKIPAGGGAGAVWALFPGGVKIQDFDFDANGNIWAGGANASIYRVTPAGNVKAFPFVATCRSFRVYNGSLYVGAKTDSLESVWSFQIISSDSLGPAQKYFDFSGKYVPNGPGVQCITFSSDGDLYIGTDAAEGVIVVHQGGSSEPLYPGNLAPMPVAFAWGKGFSLYFSRLGTTTPHQMFVINTLKLSAPYYGLQ